MNDAPTKVFITYSQDNDHRKKVILDLSQRLRREGIEAKIDQLEPHPDEGWFKWMEKQFIQMDLVLVAPSERYKSEFEQIARKHSGARYEGSMLSNFFYQEGASFKKIALILIDESDKNHIPQPLLSGTYYNISTEAGYIKLYRWITNQPEIVPETVGSVRRLVSQIENNHELKVNSPFQEICGKIHPLMRENKRIFESFGPNSGSETSAPLRMNFDVWEAKKRDSLVPNNKLIRTIIKQGYDHIPADVRMYFDALLSHIDAFEVHVNKGGAWYRDNQYPHEINDIVASNVQYD